MLAIPFPSRFSSLSSSLLFLLLALFPYCCFGTPIASPLDCVDLICPEGKEAAEEGIMEHHHHMDLLDNENNKLDKCRDCQDCTTSGFSVCLQPQHYEAQTRHLVTDKGKCQCAHSGPAVAANATDQEEKCRVLTNTRRMAEPELDIDEAIFHACYSSAFRKLPTPKATNDDGMSGHPVLVTVDQFWHSNYWKALRPQELYLFYVFPVSKEEHCEAKVHIPNAQDMMWINAGKSRHQVTNSGLTFLCKASLRILMSGIEPEVDEDAPHYSEEPTETENAPAAPVEKEPNYYEDEEYDPNQPPEVQFERDVFAGANKVRFYYELKVHRDNLFKAGAGKPKFAARTTLIKSDSLDFDLHPEIYGSGTQIGRNRSHSGRGGGGHINPVKIEQHKTGGKGEEGPREPIVRPAGRTGAKTGTKSAERTKTTKHHHMSTSISPSPTSSSSSSSLGPRPIQSRPASESAHDIGHESTLMSVPNGEEEYSETPTPTKANDGDEGNDDEGEDGEDSSSIGRSSAAGNDDPTEEDWLLLRNIVLITLLVLATFLIVAFCYKRGICCFPSTNGTSSSSTANGGQQRNGKTRVQNGKEYRQANGGK